MRISDWSSDVCSSDLPFCGPQSAGRVDPHSFPLRAAGRISHGDAEAEKLIAKEVAAAPILIRARLCPLVEQRLKRGRQGFVGLFAGKTKESQGRLQIFCRHVMKPLDRQWRV